MEKVAIGTIKLVVSVVKGVSKSGKDYELVIFENDDLGQVIRFQVVDDTNNNFVANMYKKVCVHLDKKESAK